MHATRTEVGDHSILLYDETADLVAEVSRYVAAGLTGDESVIAIMTSEHQGAVDQAMRSSGLAVDAARAEGRYTTAPAQELLGAFMQGNRIDPAGFRKVAGDLVHQAAASGRPVRLFCEMVALLLEGGDVLTAIALELLWNDVGRTVPFTLFCAYPSVVMDDSELADAMQQVCALHTSQQGPNGHLGGSSASAAGTLAPADPAVPVVARFDAKLSSPRHARHFLTRLLRERGYEKSFTDDSAFVLTELAANAVIHATSPFTVEIREVDGCLRISVFDDDAGALEDLDDPGSADLSPLTLPGRGLDLVAKLSRQWGMSPADGGKVVWAELPLQPGPAPTAA